MKKTLLGLTIATVILGGLAASTTNSAFAYRGDPTVEGPYHTQEREALMDKAFESNDFVAWSELMNGRGRVTQVVNANNFAQFAKAHQLAEEGRIHEANQIRQNLGLGLHDGSGYQQGGMGMHRNQW